MDIRWFIASLWRITVFALYTFPLNAIKVLLLPLSFFASWILPIAPRKMSGVPATNPQVHDFDKIYNYKTLEGFGYVFHNGHMVDKETGQSFIFDVYDGDREKNQIRYEQIGKAVNDYIYRLLEEETGLKIETVPINAKEGESTSFIFTTDNLDTCDKLMLIIHGAGVVRAGQWARRLIINHSLESGTQLPYIKRAKERGYGIIVTNTNLNKDEVTGKKIKFNDSPKAHFDYVWEHFVQPKLNIKHVAIVAHSYGGVVTVDGALKHEDLIKRVFAVAFTDSVHSVGHRRLSKEFIEWLKTCCRNWVSSDKPLNEEDTNEFIKKYAKNDCLRLSAGTSVHEETSWKAFEKVWEFIDLMLEERLNPKPENIKRKTEGTEKTEVKGKVKKVKATIKDFFKGGKIKGDTENHQSEETVDEVGEDVAAGYVVVSENTENYGSSTDIRKNKINKFDSEKSEIMENRNNEGEPTLKKEDLQESDMDMRSGNNEVDRENNPIMEDGENNKIIENKNKEDSQESDMDMRSGNNEVDRENNSIMEDGENSKIIENKNKEDSQESDMDMRSGNNEADRENNPIMEDGENSKIIENKNNKSETVKSKNMEVDDESNEDVGEDTKIMENLNKVDIEKNKITENHKNGVEHILTKEDSHEIVMDVESANDNDDGDKTKDNDDLETDKANDEFGENKITKDDGDKETTENKNSKNDYTQVKSDFQEANMDVDKTSNSQENSEEEPMRQTPSEEL